jgi:IPT/TIG domain
MRRQFRFEVGPSEPAGEPIPMRLKLPFSTFRVTRMMLCLVALGGLVGCGGGSGNGNQAPPPSNPNPSLATGSLNPSSAVAGGPGFTLTVTGTNFISSSTVQWNGSVRTTTFVSGTSLQAAITAADIATAGTAQVSVSTPGPGGGMTSMLTFTINNPQPRAASLNPSSAVARGAAFTLTVTGTNFVSSSTVQWNGSLRTTTFVSTTSLQAAITAADITAVGMAMVTVLNPAPGGGPSGALPFSIVASVPAIKLLNPSSAVAGSSGFTLTVTGTNFVSSSTVQWKGSPRTTTFVSSTELQAAITAADIAAIGVAKVAVVNPAANGGISAASTFFIGSTGGTNFAVIAVNQAAQDIVFDRKNQVLYLSVTGTAATHPNTISILDPATGTITSSQLAGSNPNVLAISDDSQFLYAGIDGSSSVRRFTLPGLVTDINYPLPTDSFGGGPFFALDLQVAPGAPHTTAATLAVSTSTPSAQGGITIFDDGTARPTIAKGFGPGGGGGVLYDSLQWGSDATALFAANNEDTGFDFYTLSVNSSGVVLNQDFGNRFSSFGNRIHFDAGTKLIYGDNGQTVDPNGVPAGNFNTSGVMVPDSTLNTAFFISAATIQSFDLTHFTPINSITIPNVSGGPIRLIRWGQNGLAFNTTSGQVFLVGGNFVSPAPPLTLTPPPIPTPPPTPAANAPTITLLNPSSTLAGGSGFTLNVTGTKFDPAAVVHFNGTPLTTSFVSNTQLQAAITAANISTAGTAKITVANPLSNGGVSAPSTFFIGSSSGISSGGMGFAAITVNQAAKDIAFDPLHGAIYLSVPGSVAGIGNTVSVLDPSSATITGSAFAGSSPNVLAISDDDQFLYSGIDGSASVQRFTLPALATDIKYSLGADSFFGPYFALDLQVAPGSPHTTAVTPANVGFSPSAQGGIIIFDDANARPTKAPGFGGTGHLFDSLQWGSDATALFAANYEDTGFDFYTLSVTPSGVVLVKDYPNTFSSFSNRIHFDAGTKLVYAEDGHVVDPSTGLPAGNFNTSGRMVPDSTLNKAFFLTGSGSPTVTITSFDLKLFTQIDSITVNNVTGNPRRLIRWGQNGLAFNTDSGQVFLIGGNFVH